MNRVLLHLFFIFISTLVYSQIYPVKIFEQNRSNTNSTFPNRIVGIEFIDNGNELFIINNNATERWDFNSNTFVNAIPGATIAYTFNHDFSLFATDGGFGKILLINVESGEVHSILEGHNPTIGSGRNEFSSTILFLEFSNHGRYLVSNSNDGKTILWDIDTLNTLKTGIGPGVFTPNDMLLASGPTFWNISNFEKEFEINDDGYIAMFNDGGNLYITADIFGNINIWDWMQKQLIFEMHLHERNILSFDATKNDEYLISSGSDRKVHIYEGVLMNYSEYNMRMI